MKDILGYRCVQNWLLGLEPTTVRCYVVPFREFCMQSQKSPDDILRDAKADKTEFHYSLKKYWRNLQQQGVGASTRTKGYFTVRSFLFHNDIYLGKAPPYFKWRVEWAKRHLLTDKEV